jgi:hypothetical protein
MSVATAPLDLEEHQLPRRLRAVSSEPPLDQQWDLVGAAAVLPLVVSAHPAALTPARRQRPVRERGASKSGRRQPRTSDAELGQLFGPEPTPRAALPDPRPRAAAAVRVLLEVLCGDRPTRQIAGLVSPAVLERLERRHPDRFRAEPRHCQLRSLHVSEPADCVAEVAAVVFVPSTRRGSTRERCRAVALRLEGSDGRWTVTALTVG